MLYTYVYQFHKIYIYIYNIYTLNLTIMLLLGTLSIDDGCIIPMCSTMDMIKFNWDEDEYKTKMG